MSKTKHHLRIAADSPADLAHFTSIPWCSALIADPTFRTTITPSLVHKPSTEDALFSDTLKSASTIPACLTIYEIPPEEIALDGGGVRGGDVELGDAVERKGPTTTAAAATAVVQDARDESAEHGQKRADRPGGAEPHVTRSLTFFSLQSGLNGHPHICHGGIVATMLDESCGILMALTKDLREAIAEAAAQRADAEGVPRAVAPARGAEFTVELTVRYLRPVRTPGTVVVETVYERVEGRKIWLVARMRDGEGKELAVGRALFVVVGRERL